MSLTKKRVLVLYCGGSIGMKKNEENVLVPAPHVMLDFLRKQRDMHDPVLAKKYYSILQPYQLVLPEVQSTVLFYEIMEYEPLLDSSNMGPPDWIRLATDIGRYYDTYDGFVVIHGTDTLSFTASALSFMLEGLGKTVIITGGQVPIYELRTDSKDNLQLSLIMAGCYEVPEVCVLSARRLLRGNRSIRSSCASIDCFASINYPDLADIGLSINVHSNLIRQPDPVPFKVVTTLNTNVAVVRFTPTLLASTMEAVVKSSLDAIVLQTYGTGTMRDNDEELLKVLKWTMGREIIVVNITQCFHGSVCLTYETGKWLDDIGVANGKDMTCEAAIAKLCYVLAQKNLTRKDKIKMMETNLRGEMSD